MPLKGFLQLLRSVGTKALGALKTVFKSPKSFINIVKTFIGGYEKGGVKKGLELSARHGINSFHTAYKKENLKKPNPQKPKLTRSAEHPFKYPRHRLATRGVKRSRAHLEKDQGYPGIWEGLKGIYNTIARGTAVLPKIPDKGQDFTKAQREKAQQGVDDQLKALEYV